MAEEQRKNVKVAKEDTNRIKMLWFDLILARKNYNLVGAIYGQNLPKVAYSKRKNGKKKRLNASVVKTGSKKLKTINREPSRLSKHMNFFGRFMQAGMILQKAETAFSEALAEQEKKKGGSIKDLIQTVQPA